MPGEALPGSSLMGSKLSWGKSLSRKEENMWRRNLGDYMKINIALHRNQSKIFPSADFYQSHFFKALTNQTSIIYVMIFLLSFPLWILRLENPDKPQ